MKKQPAITSHTVDSHTTKRGLPKTLQNIEKRALSIPPRPFQPPAQAAWQQKVVQPYGQPGTTTTQPANMQQNMAGRPAGSAGGTAGAVNPVPQTGVGGQQSVVGGLTGSSTQQTRGFGNTPISGATGSGSSSGKSAKSPTAGAAKAANALMGYGPGSPSMGSSMNMTSPMSMSMPASVGMRMPSMGSSLGMAAGSRAAGLGGSPRPSMSPKMAKQQTNRDQLNSISTSTINRSMNKSSSSSHLGTTLGQLAARQSR